VVLPLPLPLALAITAILRIPGSSLRPRR